MGSLSWIVIVVLVLLIFYFLRVRHFKTKFYAILIILFLLFFYVTVSGVVEENDINIKTFDGMVAAGKLYMGWLGHVFENVRVVVGNAIKMNWGSNSTLS